ncbi:MAG: excinuclease ABC subunit UvrC [Candidatus Dojkabacteria bacterium]|nr:MAG: excinuclease ABC subunit UvrC [Candidatus Dojkabacteria bacterium]
MYPSVELQNIVKNSPFSPGCYIYRDKHGTVLYVGKAKIIRKRIKSYFDGFERQETKIQRMVKQISTIEFVTTDSELEALLLETNLIKKYRPKYNSRMKDDKNYIWLKIDTRSDFPTFRVVREVDSRSAEYIGPFPNTLPVKRILSGLRRIYPYRTCNRKIVQNSDGSISSSDAKPCLYYYLGLCQAPCAGMIQKKDYRTNISRIKSYFLSDKETLKQELESEMKKAASEHNFELAAELRDKSRDLDILSQRIRVRDNTDENEYRKTREQKLNLAMQELTSKLDVFDIQVKKGFKIECFDISNIQGKYAVASMVVFIDAKADKGKYRKFRIQTKDTPDDFAMMKEALSRRFKKQSSKDDSFSRMPDLLIVDGGKGQLSTAFNLLQELGISIPVIGLAKRMEEIFIPVDKDGELTFLKRTLKAGSEGKFLIQRIRDESHRFAITYHRALRAKGQLASNLDMLPGIGAITKKNLLRAFGSIEGIKKASESDLLQIIKHKKRLQTLRDFLNSKK